MKAQIIKHIGKEPNSMKQRFESRIYNALIEKYGYDEFEVDWAEIANVFELPVLQTKYQFSLMERSEIIKVEK